MTTSPDHESWKLLATVVPAALALGTALIYGLLVLAYSEFYRELGVRPSDVGLDYGRGIGGAAGIAIVLVAVGALATVVYLIFARVRKGASEGVSRNVAIVVVTAISLVCILAVFPFARFANSRADQVKNGRAVEPVGVLGVELLAVRADPAKLQLIGPLTLRSDLLSQVGAHRLFYLGRSAATIVLYDQTTQRAVHVPAATVTVETSNCETDKNQDAVCMKLRK